MVGHIGDFPMKDYGAFRKMLEEKGLIYLFHDDTGTYDIYRGWWGDKKIPPGRVFPGIGSGPGGSEERSGSP